MIRIGVDLGGTKIEAIALAGSAGARADDGGREIARQRVPTPAHDYDAIVGAIVDLVARVESQAGERATAIGVGTPGAASPATGLLRNSNTVCLNGRPLAADLTAALHRPVRLANDANCFALSEATDGAGAGAATVFGVILGTGVGGGVVVGGRVLGGANAVAGEWGHNPLPAPRDDERPGPACYCGRRGCIETFLSGPALRAQHAAATGRDVTPAAIESLARAGDAAAREALARWHERLARCLATVINLLDPDVIVLGGGLSNLDATYDAVPALWGAHVFSDVVRTRLVRARHGDSSGVRGAAWLWPEAPPP